MDQDEYYRFVNSDLYKRFNKPISMEQFMEKVKHVSQFSLSGDDIKDAISSACNFFRIPYPRVVYDFTDVQGGQTMFANADPYSYNDDILCFNMRQLIELGVNSKESFSLIMTHECAHRFSQRMKFPGINNGQWERELACDFFMGVRAGMNNINIASISAGLMLTRGSASHPEGIIRYEFVRFGCYLAIEWLQSKKSFSFDDLMNEYYQFLQLKQNDILKAQHLYYTF